MSKFRVGQHVVIGTHTPAYGAFSQAHEQRGTPILGLGVLIRAINSRATEDGGTVIDYDVQAHPTMADIQIGGTVQVLREEDLVADLRSKFQPGQRVRVVAEVPSHGAWDDSNVQGWEGVIVQGPSDRPQSEPYPSGFVVTVDLDGYAYSQNVNPEDLEPLEN